MAQGFRNGLYVNALFKAESGETVPKIVHPQIRPPNGRSQFFKMMFPHSHSAYMTAMEAMMD